MLLSDSYKALHHMITVLGDGNPAVVFAAVTLKPHRLLSRGGGRPRQASWQVHRCYLEVPQAGTRAWTGVRVLWRMPWTGATGGYCKQAL